ncbi:hypothetical protein SBRCBS47491_000180 [Sporothrix bragantina]|uniref:Uncharacterized protein n=1 Tax=Sporothrix bragantina TaxID=671064 RepID=A0ABP0AN79_9PEZI
MVSALLSAAVLFGAAAEAIKYKPAPYKPARATVLPEIPGDAMSPKPTSPPELRRQLVNRDTGTTVYYAPDNTCGYLSGMSDNAYTCNDGDAQCAIITLSKSGFIGCCDDGECGGFHLTCIDSSQFNSGTVCGSSCASDTFTLKCTDSDTPYCNSVSINGGASLKVYGYFCNDVAISTMQAILTTYSGETDGRSFSASLLNDGSLDSTAAQTETFGGDGSGSTTTSAHTTSSTSGGGGSNGNTTPTPTPPTPTPTPAPKKSTNTGAIAGGVVGGVAGLALIGAAIFFILRHQRKNSAMTPAAGAPGAAGAAPGGAPGVGPGGAPLAGAAVAGAAAAGSPGMSQVNTPPPQPYYADPSKTPEYAYAGQGSPQPGQQPYYQGQPQPYPPQQPYYAAAAVAPSPDRTDSTSPLPAGSSMHDYRLSSVSAAGSSPYAGAISPQTTGHTSAMGVMPGQAQVPPTIHEAGGNAIGVANENHHGEMHELA